MKTYTITTYEFEELSEEAQQKAIKDNWDINVDYSWWIFIYGDAQKIGLKIIEFNLDRRNCIKGEFTDSTDQVAKKIIETHGDTTDTYITAQAFLEEIKDIDPEEEDYKNKEQEFLKALLEDYWIILKNEYEYFTSERAIKEALIGNKFEFTEDGNFY